MNEADELDGSFQQYFAAVVRASQTDARPRTNDPAEVAAVPGRTEALAEAVGRHRAALIQASSPEQWLNVVSNILRYWIDNAGLPDEVNKQRDVLLALVRRGPKGRPRHRVLNVLEAKGDADVILGVVHAAAIEVARGRQAPPAASLTRAVAAQILASARGIERPAAEKRVDRAEPYLGFSLRRAAPFGKK